MKFGFFDKVGEIEYYPPLLIGVACSDRSSIMFKSLFWGKIIYLKPLAYCLELVLI